MISAAKSRFRAVRPFYKQTCFISLPRAEPVRGHPFRLCPKIVASCLFFRQLSLSGGLSVASHVAGGLHVALHEHALLFLLGQLVKIQTFLTVPRRFGAEGVLAWLYGLVVTAENSALPPLWWLLGDVKGIALAATHSVCGAGGEEHGCLVARLGRHVSDVGAAHVLVKAVHAVLQISRVVLISLRRFMGPEMSWLFGTLGVVRKISLALDQAPNARLSQLFHQFLFVEARVQILILIPLFIDLLDLLEPFERNVCVPLHCLGDAHARGKALMVQRRARAAVQ